MSKTERNTGDCGEVKARKPGTFLPGNPGGPGRGKKKAVLVGRDIYDDLHAAYTTPNGPDDSPGVKMARQLLVEDYKTFVAMYMKGREEQRMASDATSKEGTVGPKEERLNELLEQLLSECAR